jgi:hypothetical protein
MVVAVMSFGLHDTGVYLSIFGFCCDKNREGKMVFKSVVICVGVFEGFMYR